MASATRFGFARSAAAAIAGCLAVIGPSLASEELITKLEHEGFFKYESTAKATAVKTAIRKEGWSGLYSVENRLVSADAEDLAEGGVCALLESAKRFLSAQGVTWNACSDEYEETNYTILIDGARATILSVEDLKRGEREAGRTWGTSSKKTADLLNALLRSAKSPERAYGLYGGNDFHIFFLTPVLKAVIADAAKAEPQEIPYEVTDEAPWFGALH